MSSFIWYELMTTEPAVAADFYGAVVGWTFTPGSPETGDYGFITRPDGGMTGGVFTLTDGMCQQGARPCWIGYMQVADCDAAVAGIEAAGGKVMVPARDVPMAGRIAMVTDCCGAAFYVMTPTPPPGGGQSTAFAAMPVTGACGWNELYAGNFAAAMKFYTGQFGWTEAGSMDMAEMGTYQFVADGEVTLGAIMQRPPEMPVSAWVHYFWVDDIAQAKQRIEANGGTIMMGPQEVPGPLWIIQGRDPQDAHFALVSPQ